MQRIRFLGVTLLLLAAAWLWTVDSAEANACGVNAGNAGYVCGYNIPPTFVTPEPREDSFLPRSAYARLADYADVYAQPSRSAAIVRNVGDGFLFASLNGAVESEGETWYVINAGEYVPADDIKLATISEFRGVRVVRQPERSFGWIVAEVRPSPTPGGPAPLYLPRMERYDFFEVYDAVEAEDGWIWYDIGNGRWIRQTYVSLVDPSPRPLDIPADARWVEVDLYEQTMAAYEGDRMVFASLVSSGLNRWPTNEGVFQVYDRWEHIKMSGAEGKIDYYFVEDVPHTMYFDYDIALHGAYWHDRFGYKHSHGCVNIPPFAAEWLYYWDEDAQNDLWVYVHTSDPYHYFERNAVSIDGAPLNIPVEDGRLYRNLVVIN